MAIPLFLSKESEGYNPLERSDSEISETEVPLQKRQRKQWSTIQVFIMLLVSIIVSSISGFTFGVRRQISPGRALLGMQKLRPPRLLNSKLTIYSSRWEYPVPNDLQQDLYLRANTRDQ